MFEFLLKNNNLENPTAFTILITVLSSFFLSSLIVLTYELTTKSIHRSANFLQSLALISIVAATVMQAIGDSLARGLGMLGALAIIRFRTKLDDPRNMTFMFAALAAGISCGVFGFTIAFIGTIGFCIGAIILKFSPLSITNELIGTLKVEIPQESHLEQEIDRLLRAYCTYVQLEQIRFLNLFKTKKIRNSQGNIIEEIPLKNRKELTYLFRIKPYKSISEMATELETFPELRNVRLRLGKEDTTL